MSLIRNRNIILHNPETKSFLADSFYKENAQPLPLVIFCHGYKGYKDWGAWNILAEELANAGFFFVKFNFSFNGTTLENPNQFDDLEAFGNDNFTKQLSDLQFVIDEFSKNDKVDGQNICLIGHSRGGGVVTLKAAEDHRVQKLITLAGVDHLDFFPKNERLEEWKEKGVFYTLNGRTKQSMPHFIQLYRDFQENAPRFNVGNHARTFHGKSLIIHGTQDEAVSVSAAQNLHHWLKNSELKLIEHANHTFGAKEPWEHSYLPKHLAEVSQLIIQFLS